MKICILSLRTLSFDEATVRALPFGDEECDHLCSIRNPARARSSLGARLALQALIGGQAYPLVRTPIGKPYFADPYAPFFSLAHTESLAVAVLADPDEGSIGVDIEELRPLTKASQIATRFFTEAERADLAVAPSPETFFTIWTAKEATAKMSGKGLSATLADPTATAKHVKHFRLMYDDGEAILCVATEHPARDVATSLPPAMQIQEI